MTLSQAVTWETISLPHYCGVSDSQIYCDFQFYKSSTSSRSVFTYILDVLDGLL